MLDVTSRFARRSARLVAVGCVAVAVMGCQQPRQMAAVRLDGLERLAAETARKDAGQPIRWYDGKQLTIEGKAWSETDKFYERLPARAKGLVPDPVWARGKYSTGLCVRFVTDSSCIHVNWRVTSPNLAMNHMPASSVSGVDLYVRYEGRWTWLALGPPDKTSNEMALVKGLSAEPREYMLYLPLYNSTESLEIGVDEKAVMAKPAPRPEDRRKPVVIYGTSIVHGGCCSRAGMAYPAILGRRLDRPTVNLGFSGSGRMEIELADLLAEIDAAVYVLDCLPNLEAQMVTERVEPFVRKLRAARPNCPIVLVENITYQDSYLVKATRDRATGSNRALAEAYGRLKNAGVRGLYYVPGDQLLGDDHEATVDSTHPTDLGMTRIAGTLEPVLRKVLNQH